MADLQCLQPSANDIKMMVLADAHFSAKKCEPGMKTYVYGKAEGTMIDNSLVGCCLMDLQKTWDKLVLAARVLAAVEDPSTIYCVGQRPYAQRAIIKFAKEIGATAAPGRFTPGQFTNAVTQQFVEPRILIVADPRTDSQAVKEGSYVNIPTIAFCGSDSPLEYVDIAIPGNNRGKESLGLLYWMLAREVRRIRGDTPRDHQWEVKVDLFIYRDPEEVDAQQAEELGNQEEELEDYGYGYDLEQGDPNAFYGDAQQQEFATEWEQGGATGAAPVNPAQGDWGQSGPNPMGGVVQGDWNDAGAFDQQQAQQAPAQNWGGQQQGQQNFQQQGQQNFQQQGQQNFQQQGQGFQQQGQQAPVQALDDWDED